MVELFVLILQSLPSSSETQQNLPQTGYEVFNPGCVEYQIIGREDMDWTDLAQDKDKWRALVNTVMTFQSYAVREIS